MKTSNALYLAGTILLGAAFISRFQEAELITMTILVLLSTVLLFLGYRDQRKKGTCKRGANTTWKFFGLGFGVMIVFFGLGFAVGKLIYLWTQ